MQFKSNKRTPWIEVQPDTGKPAVCLPLTRGEVALVDLEDMLLVNKKPWFAAGRAARVYATCLADGGRVMLHRLLMGFPAGYVDHVNGDTRDNRRANLRLADASQNSANSKPQSKNASQFKGVSKARNRWKARLKHHGLTEYLGVFDSEAEAAQAYDSAAKRLFGEFSRLNFPTA